MENPIYLDYNATTPVDEVVGAAMAPFLAPGLSGAFGNASSGYSYGQQAKQALATARSSVAGLLGARPTEITFCSGGTESVNHVLKSTPLAFWRRSGQRGHIVTSCIEHPAVREACEWVREYGFADVTYVAVGSDGVVDPGSVKAALRPNTCLVSIMLANNETGALQPVALIAAAVRAAATGGAAIVIHTDASQAAGKVDISVDALGVDALSLAGHKLYCPKGVGATFIRSRAAHLVRPFIHGASQEAGQRAGTENVALAVALGAAAEAASARVSATGVDAHSQHMRDALLRCFRLECASAGLEPPAVFGPLSSAAAADEASLPHATLSSTAGGTSPLPDTLGATSCAASLPNTLFLALRGAPAVAMLSLLRDSGVACSAGAACHSTPSFAAARPLPVSRVLVSMGVEPALAACALRFSTGQWSTVEEMQEAAKRVVAAAVHVRAAAAAEVAAPAPLRTGTVGAAATTAGGEGEQAQVSPQAAPAEETTSVPHPMRTQQLYLDDTYAFSCEAAILGVAWAAPAPQGTPASVATSNGAAASEEGGGGSATAPAARGPMVLLPEVVARRLWRCGSDAAAAALAEEWYAAAGAATLPLPAALIVGAAVPPHSFAVVVDRTVGHPQGGGQPSDRGIIALSGEPAGVPAAAGVFEFYTSKWGTGMAADEALLHYGRFAPPLPTCTPSALAETAGALPELPAPQQPPAPVAGYPEELVQHAASGSCCTVVIHEPHRRLAARLHSAGHLLDLAVRHVSAGAEAVAAGLPALKPGKGLHFPSGSNVEYEGLVPAAFRDRFAALLNAECAALIGASAPTAITRLLPGDRAGLTALGISAEDVKHLPPSRPVRIVELRSGWPAPAAAAAGTQGSGGACPCGGTHVKASGEIGRLTVRAVKAKKGRTTVSYVVG